MEVLHICNNFISSAVHQKMAQASRKNGIRNTVFAPVVTLQGRVTPGEDEIVSDCVDRWDRFFFYHKQKKILHALKKQIPSYADYDVVHAHCIFSDGNAALRLKKETGMPYIVAVNNTDLNHFFRLRRFLRKRGLEILKEASYIVFASDAYQNALFDRYVPHAEQAALRDKARVIPFGMDDFWLENQYANPKTLPAERRLRLFYAGDICANKNLTATTAAMGLLREKGWEITLTVAGKVLDRGLHERITAERGVTYVGQQPKEKLIELYRQSDLFVMPSFKETFGLVYAEALSQGVPVIYSEEQGFDAQFEEGLIGFHVDPHSPEDIAAAVERVAAEYMRIQGNCARAAEKFSWSKISGQYKELYLAVDKRTGSCKDSEAL